MSTTINGQTYDYVGECFDCPNALGVFVTRGAREEWLKQHADHDVDYYMQARV